MPTPASVTDESMAIFFMSMSSTKNKEGDIAERMFLEDLRRNAVNENLTERRNLSE